MKKLILLICLLCFCNDGYGNARYYSNRHFSYYMGNDYVSVFNNRHNYHNGYYYHYFGYYYGNNRHYNDNYQPYYPVQKKKTYKEPKVRHVKTNMPTLESINK